MKKIFDSATVLLAAAVLFAACGKDNKTPDPVSNPNDALFEQIASTFLTKTVYPTYTALAAESEELAAKLGALKAAKTQANVDAACAIFLKARADWEKSEAFLFGAATDFGIDPHIDSWPLDETQFNNLMGSPKLLEGLEGEDGDAYANDNLGNTLLGFHGIEYILFEGGKPKDAAKITADQLTYAAAVGGDLRNHCYQLEVSWVGEAAPKAHREKVEALEYNTTVSGSDRSYGENMLNAGKAGSTYPSWTAAMQAILQGSSDIADEVGTSKIGKPNSGEDVTYIESPYSYNSITDFYDNIVSIQNAYYGGIAGNRDEARSLHAFFSKNKPELDKKIVDAIDKALAEIGTGEKDPGTGMKFPFVNNITDASVKEAISACADLVKVLSEAKSAVAR